MSRPLISSGGIIASDYAFLPFDILVSLVDSIALRPRLLAVSLVCKRWRTAVLQTIHRLSLLSLKVTSNAISLFPNLTKIRFLSCNEVKMSGELLVLPRLRAQQNCTSYVHSPAESCMQFTGLTSLTSLELNCNSDHTLLFEQCRSSLTHLLISRQRALPNTCFPALRSIDFGQDAGHYPLPFLPIHAALLTRLSIQRLFFVCAPQILFPQLRELHLPGGDTSFGLKPGVVGWSSSQIHFPLPFSNLIITELFVECCSPLSNLQSMELEFLHRLVLTSFLGGDPACAVNMVEALAGLPFSAILATLQINLHYQLPRIPQLGHLPSLTVLRLSDRIEVLPSVLAQLTCLEFRCILPPAVLCNAYLQHCRKLRTLSISIGATFTQSVLSQLLTYCVKIGIECVTARSTSIAAKAAAQITVPPWIKFIEKRSKWQISGPSLSRPSPNVPPPAQAARGNLKTRKRFIND